MQGVKFITGQLQQHYVITADIIQSRRRRDAAAQAEAGLAALNARYRDQLTAPFTLYRGDEIQGALCGSVDIARALRHLRFFCLGLMLRVGVGRGAITGGLDKEYAWQMDGSAFHYSREALEKIKRRREPATRFAGKNEALWSTVNAFYGLIDSIESRWSEKQWQAVDAYERGGTFEIAARELEISPQSVAKRCRAAGWKAVAEAERFLKAYIEECSG